MGAEEEEEGIRLPEIGPFWASTGPTPGHWLVMPLPPSRHCPSVGEL